MLNLTLEFGDQVGQFVFRVGAEVHRSLRGFSSSGDSAAAVPIGTGGAVVGRVNCTLVQGSLMWALSRKIECGIVTTSWAMFASPGLAVRVAVSAGCWARLTPPLSLSASFGPKGSVGAVGGLVMGCLRRRAPSSPTSLGADREGSQLVGLRAKPGRSRSIRTYAGRSGTPSRICGSGSESR